jgi:hypothetical protein
MRILAGNIRVTPPRYAMQSMSSLKNLHFCERPRNQCFSKVGDIVDYCYYYCYYYYYYYSYYTNCLVFILLFVFRFFFSILS